MGTGKEEYDNTVSGRDESERMNIMNLEMEEV